MKYVIANLWEEIGQRTQLKCVRTLRRKGDPNLRGLLTVDLFNTNLIACGGEEGAVEVWLVTYSLLVSPEILPASVDKRCLGLECRHRPTRHAREGSADAGEDSNGNRSGMGQIRLLRFADEPRAHQHPYEREKVRVSVSSQQRLQSRCSRTGTLQRSSQSLMDSRSTTRRPT